MVFSKRNLFVQIVVEQVRLLRLLVLSVRVKGLKRNVSKWKLRFLRVFKLDNNFVFLVRENVV